MKINYDIEKIGRILQDLNLITGLTLGFWDNNMNLLAAYPSRQSDFCGIIRATEKGLSRCLECDRIILKQCALTGTVCTRICHAGLCDSALPLYHNGKLLGFITFGQQINDSLNPPSYEEITQLISELKVDTDKLFEGYSKLPHCDQKRLNATTAIFEACIQHTIISKSVSVKNEELHESISDYIQKNLGDPKLSYKTIAKQFHISKSALYNLFNRYFGASVNSYVELARMERAKSALTDTDKSILEVAIGVGIADQNYFSRCFKKHVGVSPTKYRANSKAN